MSDLYTPVDVAVVLITDPTGRMLLVDYSPKWHFFTFPMTKVDDEIGAGVAAVRAAVEVLGCPFPPDGGPVPLGADIPVYQTSPRDGEKKRDHYLPYALKAGVAPQPLPGHVALWLTPDQLETHEPMSPTVRHILRAIPFAEVLRAAK